MLDEERYQKGGRSKKALTARLRYAAGRKRPETSLALAVIEQAAFDLRVKSKADQREAREFISSDRLDFWCDLIELDPDYAREVIADHYPEILEDATNG